jgi:putative peptide modification system cyclase
LRGKPPLRHAGVLAAEAASPRTMSADPASVEPDRPVIRTLLVSDLVDSTAMLERLGDHEAARVLAAEDEVGRMLAHRYDGQEIDKSDGFLFLFPHVWQAVGFAVEYHRRLADLSHTLTMPLRARIGIHTGEVILQRHSAADVAQGAKQTEVSGLAKPVAARLMSAAHPGQTLLSEAAMKAGPGPCLRHLPLELDLQWHAHGRYQLKGVSEPLQVFEVAAGAAARPREPLDSPKIRSLRRQMRRNLLRGAAAAAAVAAVPAGVWWYREYTRFEFPRASWLVLSDWIDHSGDAALPTILQTAFRIALDQSRFAYVMNDAAVRETLVRMRRSQATGIDRAAAVEIARRERAEAVILPGVDVIEIGHRISATIIDPWKDRVVQTHVVAVSSTSHLTSALDDLAAQVRKTLGESIDSIVKDSRPLAKVTTADLTALQFYSEAELKVRQRDAAGAVKLLEQALAIDPEFASAYAKLGTIQMISRYDPRVFEENWRRAIVSRDRLTRREQMYIEAHLASTTVPEEMRARWSAMYTVFPDDVTAGNNVAWLDWAQYGRYENARETLLPASKILHPWQYRAWHNLGYLHLVIGRLDEADASFRASLEAFDDPVHFGMVRALIARADLAQAKALLTRYLKPGESAGVETERSEAQILVAVAQRDLKDAMALAERLAARALELDFAAAARVAARARYWLAAEAGDEAVEAAAFEGFLAGVQKDAADDVGGMMLVPRLDLLLLGAAAIRRGRQAQLEALGSGLRLDGRWQRYPVLQAASMLIEGWRHYAAGRYDQAVQASHDSRLRAPLFLASELAAMAQHAMNDRAALAVTLRSEHAQLHRALGESYNYFGTQIVNLLAWQRMQGLAG